jgi:hypothetical protein
VTERCEQAPVVAPSPLGLTDPTYLYPQNSLCRGRSPHQLNLVHMAYTFPFVPPTFLNVTALSAQNGSSVLECWQILPGFSTSAQTGTIGASILQLGNLANMSYSVIPPGFDAGLHNAPTAQCVTSRIIHPCTPY